MISYEIDAGSLYVALKSGQNRKRNKIREAVSRAFDWAALGLAFVVFYFLDKVTPNKSLL